MQLESVKSVERSSMLEFSLGTWEAERSNHKLLNDRVYFHFAVKKKSSKTDTNERQIHFDFTERIFTNLNKESERSNFPFESLISYSKSETDPLYIKIEFKKAQASEFYLQTVQEREILLSMMKRVISDDIDGITNEYVSTSPDVL